MVLTCLHYLLRTLILALLFLAPFLTAHAAEERTVTAFAGWDAVGQAFEISPGNAVFMGRLSGTLYISDGQGNLNAGDIVCPGRFSIAVKSGEETGDGNCIVTAKDGSRIFGAWTCKGVMRAGCKGQMQLKGGVGQFQNASGGGTFILQSALHETVVNALTGNAVDAANGILVLSNFHYKIP